MPSGNRTGIVRQSREEIVMSEENQWKSLPSMETRRYRFGATAIGEKIYVAGGSNYADRNLSSAEVYDIKLNKWSSLPKMKKKRKGCAVTSLHGNIYALRGEVHGRRLVYDEIFDPVKNKWTRIPNMKDICRGCAACTIGDKIYVIGGWNGRRRQCCSSVDVFDTITKEWSSIPNMITKRDRCAAVSLGNKIYVFGGWDDRGYFLSSAEVYDITTQEWTQLPQMKKQRCNCAATVVGNRIYIIGGKDDHDFHSSCEVFNTSTNTWSSSIIPDMKKERYGCQAVSIGPNIYVMGGWNGSNNDTASVEVLEISMSSLYPTDENYVSLEGGYRSPKSLENLCIDQMCRSLPDLDGEIPPIFPQVVINAIHESLVSHCALNLIPLEAFRHYDLGQPTAADKRLLPLSETISKVKRVKLN